MARVVLAVLDAMDWFEAESRYSSIGRPGYRPRWLVGALVLGSLRGLHESTKLASALRTDVALRLVSGGHAISAGRLRAFRQKHLVLFADCIEQTVRIAHERGLLGEDVLRQLSVDSMRLRADASSSTVRTLDHATKRVRELEATDVSTLTPEARQAHDEKLAKHRDTIARCEQTGRTNIVTTNPSASLLKFPTGNSAPGHRITVTAAGLSRRLVIALLVDASPNDYGKLAPALEQARAVLQRAGVPPDIPLQATADAGYNTEEDLRFAQENPFVDVLVPLETGHHADSLTKGYFGRGHFRVLDDGKMLCPAGVAMQGPVKNGRVGAMYRGIGCATCSLKPQCTPHGRRVVTINPTVERRRNAMRQRMNEPGARERYHLRIGTVEPVFSNLQDTMGFRRSTCREADAIVGEILLKILAHNISRLAAAKPLAAAVFVFGPDF